MMSKGLFSAIALALLAATTACRERTGSSLKDDGDNVNIQMAAILDNTCAEAGCHESENHRLPRDVLVTFADQTKATFDCMANPANDTPQKKVDTCLKSGTSFSRSIGVYRAMVKDDSLVSLVKAAGATDVQLKQFSKVIMPPGSAQSVFESSDQWTKVRDWLVAQPPNYAGINEARPTAQAEGPDCKEKISPELQAHLNKTVGPNGVNWTKVHKDAQMPMFGCPERTDFPADPLKCLTAFPEKPEWGMTGAPAGNAKFKVRVLRSMPGFTNYWTRTSPDGRFVGNGGAPAEEPTTGTGTGSGTSGGGSGTSGGKGGTGTSTGTTTGRNPRPTTTIGTTRRPTSKSPSDLPAAGLRLGDDGASFDAAIEDLAVDGRRILVTANYDPGFSPDNTKFMFVGTICPSQQLRNAQTKSVDTSNSASGCFTDDQIQTYQSIGAEAGAGDKFTVINPGNYQVDNGGSSPEGKTDTYYVPTNPLAIHTFTKDASGNFVAAHVTATTLNESQSSISPSAALVMQRFSPGEPGGNDGGFALADTNTDLSKLLPKLGYHIRFVDKMRTDGDAYKAADDASVSEICMKGNKAMMSFDDRFMVTHHFADQIDDPANATKYSDVMLYDLVTRKAIQVTHMPVGSFALYPHFRADGWLYFLVRQWDATGQNRSDFIAATDVGLVLSQAPQASNP